MSLKNLCAVAAVGAFLLGATVASAQTWSVEQKEVWQFELSQWKKGMEKDLTWVEEMVHPNALVWSKNMPGPRNKASFNRWVRYDSANTTTLQQELFPLGIVVQGNMAVVHYRYQEARENTKKERKTVTGRFTDVLIKEGGRWMFITWAGGDDSEKD